MKNRYPSLESILPALNRLVQIDAAISAAERSNSFVFEKLSVYREDVLTELQRDLQQPCPHWQSVVGFSDFELRIDGCLARVRPDRSGDGWRFEVFDAKRQRVQVGNAVRSCREAAQVAAEREIERLLLKK